MAASRRALPPVVGAVPLGAMIGGEAASGGAGIGGAAVIGGAAIEAKGKQHLAISHKRDQSLGARRPTANLSWAAGYVHMSEAAAKGTFGAPPSPVDGAPPPPVHGAPLPPVDT